MRFWLKSMAWVLVLGGVCALVAWLTWQAARRRYAPPGPLAVRIESVSAGEVCETVSAPGVVQPRKSVKISARIAARIVEIPVDEGDAVTDGTEDPAREASLLVRLDDRDLRSRLRAVRAEREALAAQVRVEEASIRSQAADIEALDAAVREVELDHRRKGELLASRDIAQAVFDGVESRFHQEKARTAAARLRLDAARNGLEVLRHRIEAADAEIEQAEEALEYTTIRSPITGTVTAVNAEVGELVVTGTMNNPGTVIMEVADLANMLLVAEVDEADVGRVEPGQSALIHVQAYPETELRGTLESVALTHRNSSRATKYYRTEIRIEPTTVRLYSGLTADVDIRTRLHSGVLRLPTQAVLGRKVDELPEAVRTACPEAASGETHITVVYRIVDGKACVTPVHIGAADMTHTVILSGLRAGDRVVTGPYKALDELRHDRAVREGDAGDGGRVEKASGKR
ncbi:MAG: efflux RND transporter periplasmic adaptor subunit [Lentisphaeria bacterium]|nr:efflux RND transporter periplasmic adaptor subunit [Lentisphaeria bacterium]